MISPVSFSVSHSDWTSQSCDSSHKLANRTFLRRAQRGRFTSRKLNKFEILTICSRGPKCHTMKVPRTTFPHLKPFDACRLFFDWGFCICIISVGYSPGRLTGSVCLTRLIFLKLQNLIFSPLEQITDKMLT